MKPCSGVLTFCALIGASSFSHAEFVLFPNGDWEIPDGASWEENSGAGTFAFVYPDSEGNPGGFGMIDHTANNGGFGIWVTNDGVAIPLSSLGLVAGETYIFSQDMKQLIGDRIGGLKVDFFIDEVLDGSTGDMYPPEGGSDDWATYDFKVTIPPTSNGIKVVPLWGPGSSVGFDNLGVETVPVPPEPVPPIPNGDFEQGNLSWLEAGPDTLWTYPASGGNPDGYGVMTNNSDFAVWVANGGAPIALSTRGLSGGDVVTFVQDMILLDGGNIGGLKVEFLAGATFLSDTGDMYPELIGDGSTWETYSFEVTIPEAANNIKVVPLWGPESSVGYDNISFIAPEPRPFVATIEKGTLVSWTATNPDHSYQAQKSPDNLLWTDLGPAVVGTAVTSAFDPTPSPFYRVQESEFLRFEVSANGGFEDPDAGDPDCADSWTCFSVSGQPPTRITTDSRTGSASMQIRVVNDDTPNPNSAEFEQNTADAGEEISPGETYILTFWANQIEQGVSFSQNYRIQWRDEFGAVIAGGTGFQPFTAGNGEWQQFTSPALVAPEAATSAIILIRGETGSVPDVAGEVLIDDLELSSVEASAIGTLPATTGPGVGVTWNTRTGRSYQARTSPDLENFSDFGPPFTGNGNDAQIGDAIGAQPKFYQVVETP